MDDFETAVIRVWKGHWKDNVDLPSSFPKGGYVLTFHKGFNKPHKVEHYETVADILDKYSYKYCFMPPMVGDDNDIVMVGI